MAKHVLTKGNNTCATMLTMPTERLANERTDEEIHVFELLSIDNLNQNQ